MPVPVRPTARRRSWRVAALAVLLLGAIGVGGYVTWQGMRPPVPVGISFGNGRIEPVTMGPVRLQPQLGRLKLLNELPPKASPRDKQHSRHIEFGSALAPRDGPLSFHAAKCSSRIQRRGPNDCFAPV